MAVFISVTTSAFNNVFDDAQRARTNQNVRRPMRGIEVKRDTYAVIKVLDATGAPIPLVDSSSSKAQGDIGYSYEYSNFLLQAVQEQRVEKQQIIETFGEDYIYFFGERPRVYTFSAILMDTRNFNWKQEWWRNYEETFRGTKLVERNARMYLYFEDTVIEGYMIQAQAQKTTDDPYKLPLTFQVFCTNHSFVGDVGSIFTPTSNGDLDSSSISDSGIAEPDAESIASKIPALASESGGLTSFLASAANFLNNAELSVQRALEDAKNKYFGRSLSFPNQGLGNQLYVPPITNLASFPSAPGSKVRVPIHQNRDEYVLTTDEIQTPQYDEAERERVRKLLKLSSPMELEARAKSQLKDLGISTERPSAAALLLGRAAFAGSQTFGSFGMRQAEGSFNANAPLDFITGANFNTGLI